MGRLRRAYLHLRYGIVSAGSIFYSVLLLHKWHTVIRIPDEPVCRASMEAPLPARARVRSHRRPGRDEVLVEDREGDVGEQR